MRDGPTIDGRNGRRARVTPPPSPEATRLSTPPLPGESALTSGALVIGLVLMAIQLWLLTVALDRFLAGEGSQVWLVGLISGIIFAGGLLVLVVLQRRPHARRPNGGEGSFPVGAGWNPPRRP